MSMFFFFLLCLFFILTLDLCRQGGEYAILSNWGKVDLPESVPLWQTIQVGSTKTSMSIDIIATSFLVAFCTTLFGTGGPKKDLENAKVFKRRREEED